MTEKNLTTEERLAALRPIASLISKSEKAMSKLTPQTWQHSMLKENIAALRVASLLIQGKAGNSHAVLRETLEETLSPMAAMIDKAEKAFVKYLPGTSQHSLLRNRLSALRMARDLLQSRLSQRMPNE
jgi:hypothetical protein